MIKNQIIDFNKEISAGEFASKIFISFIITFTSLMILTPNLLFDTNYKSLSEIYSNSSSFDFYAFIFILFCGFIIPFIFFCNRSIYTITKSSFNFYIDTFFLNFP